LTGFEDDRVVAHHEAGHAVAALAFGRPAFSLMLGPDGGEFRETAPPPVLEECERAGPETEIKFFEAIVKATLSPSDAEKQWSRLVGLFAGRAAQRVIAGTEFDSYAAGDLFQARTIAGAITKSPSQADALLREAEMMANAVVTEGWAKVEALASELIARRSLDAEQIKATIETATLGAGARRRRHWEQLVARAEASGMTLVAREV
jgi:hypothetical protein